MLGLRRVALNTARLAVRNNSVVMVRGMSTFERRERGEENVYFQHEDERLKAEMRAKMEKLLSLEDSHAEKQDLVQLLNKKKKEDENPNQSFISKIGLDDWKYAVPIGALAAIPAFGNEMIVIGPETQLAAVFVLFCATCYKNLGPMLSKFLDDYSETVAKDLAKVDANMMVEVNESIKSHKQLLDLENDLTSVIHLRDDLAIVQADILNHKEQHAFRDAIQKKLDALMAIEEAATVSIRSRMVEKVKAEVVNQFQSDAKAKDAALNQALSVLAAGVGAKRGKDIVGEAFVKSIASYREAYSKTKPGEDPIIVQFEKDVAAVTKAPAINTAVSNVYVTHPI